MIVVDWYNNAKSAWSRLNDWIKRDEKRKPIPLFESPEVLGAWMQKYVPYTGDPGNGAGDFYLHPERLQYAIEKGTATLEGAVDRLPTIELFVTPPPSTGHQDLVYTLAGLLTLAWLGITIRAMFGDRASGRRRCPQCFYDIDPALGREAGRWMAREPRYRWLGAVSHPRALGWLARSHLLVVSSVMEGGANVIAEAARIGTPVLASRVAGNVGMLGRGYPGYFPLGDERALAALMARAAGERAFHARLKRTLRERRGLFAPSAERAALAGVLRELIG